jgi:hypothetical protein
MKTTIRTSRLTSAGLAFAAAVLNTGLVAAGPTELPKPDTVFVVAGSPAMGAENSAPGASASKKRIVTIQAIEPVSGEDVNKEVTWLGVYAEEASEALGSQLGLKSGEGLLVTYVATDSPAARAGLQKHDVLVELGDQLLVHPAQLVKLIRSHKDGDAVKLSLYRQGRKQTLSAVLGKRLEQVSWSPADPGSNGWRFELGNALNEQTRNLHDSLLRLDANKEKVKVEVERSIEAARKALEDTLRHKAHATAFGPDTKDWEALAHGGVAIGDDATVVVKKDGSSVRTIVRTDDTGTYIIVASPKKRLTVHDKEGKLVFSEEIESDEQQKKLPAALWEKVRPMLEQMTPTEEAAPKPHADCGSNTNS